MSDYGSCTPDPESMRIDGITYTHGKMDYHPDFHPNNGKPFTQEELEYLCVFYEMDSMRSLSFALGRTEKSLSQKYRKLRDEWLVEHYRQLYRKKLEAKP